MKNNLIVLSLTCSVLFACNSSDDATNTETPVSGEPITQTTAAPVSDTSMAMPLVDSSQMQVGMPSATLPTGMVPQSTPLQAQPGQSQTAQPAPTATAPGMNPPHGQPGHRCEIAVGAPLNSAPAAAKSAGKPTPSASPTTSNTAVQAQPSQTTVTTVAPGMNPAHGQPGHDCAIPVGSPLKK